MLLDRLDTFDFTAEVTATKRTAGLYYATALIGLAGYTGVAAWILSTNTARIYGFPISHDPRTAIEIALQICPMMAAIVLVLFSSARDRLARHWSVQAGTHLIPMYLAVSVLSAAVILLAPSIAVATVCGFHASMPAPMTLVWVAAEFLFDLTLIGIFTAVLYRLSGKLWLTILLFFSYIAVVVAAGERWGITSYIGFGSTVPVMLTTYSAAPLYDGAGWLLRGYWTSVTFFLLSILYSFDSSRSLRWRRFLTVSAPLLIICVLTGSLTFRLQQSTNTERQNSASVLLNAALLADASTPRLHLANLDIRLTYSPNEQTVGVQGTLTFTVPDRPVRTAWFARPALMRDDKLQFMDAGAFSVQSFGKYVRVTFPGGLSPAKTVVMQYTGTIRSASSFDLPVQAKVFDNAFFLTDTDVLWTARQAACIASSQKGCGPEENYLMSDRATGAITVVAPDRFTAVTVGEAVRKPVRSRVESVFSFPTARLTTFLIACAPFHETEAVAKNGVRVRVFRSSLSSADGDSEANLGKAILDFYQDFWPEYPRRELDVVETPAPNGEAVSYDGLLAISDKIIGSRSPISGGISNLLEFVMAHEIAHQWWGYRIVPSRAPGSTFLTESMAQFAAYKFLSSRGILSEQDALANENRRYMKARSRLRSAEIPLSQAQTGDELAYNKGAFALLSLDNLSGGLLMTRLGALMQAHSGASLTNTMPDPFLVSLIDALPEGSRPTANRLVYSTGAGI